MTVQIPKFELNSTDLTEEQFKDATEVKQGGKGFGPGNYKLKITEAQYHVNKDTGSIMNATDPTWLNVSVNLVGADGREKKHWLQVPTKSIFFKNREGKESIFLFQKLQEFFAAMGIYLNYGNYASVIKEYFSSPEALERLNGQEVSVDIGFTGPYVKFVEQGRYQIVIQDKPYEEGGVIQEFPDADSAIAFAAVNLNKKLKRFPEITKFHPAAEKRQEAKVSGDNW